MANSGEFLQRKLMGADKITELLVIKCFNVGNILKDDQFICELSLTSPLESVGTRPGCKTLTQINPKMAKYLNAVI